MPFTKCFDWNTCNDWIQLYCPQKWINHNIYFQIVTLNTMVKYLRWYSHYGFEIRHLKLLLELLKKMKRVESNLKWRYATPLNNYRVQCKPDSMKGDKGLQFLDICHVPCVSPTKSQVNWFIIIITCQANDLLSSSPLPASA